MIEIERYDYFRLPVKENWCVLTQPDSRLEKVYRILEGIVYSNLSTKKITLSAKYNHNSDEIYGYKLPIEF